MKPTTIFLGLYGLLEQRQRGAHLRPWPTPLKIALMLVLVGGGLGLVSSCKEDSAMTPKRSGRQKVLAVRALADGGAIVAGTDSDSAWLARYDGEVVRWTRKISYPDYSIFAVGPDYVVLGSAERLTELSLFNIESGAVRWSTKIENAGIARIIAGSSSVFLDAGTRWIELSMLTGETVGTIDEASADVDVPNTVVRRIETRHDDHWQRLCSCSLKGKRFDFGFDPEAERDAGRMRVTDTPGTRTTTVDFVANTCGYYQDSIVAFMTSGTAVPLRMLRMNAVGDVVRDSVILDARRDAQLSVGDVRREPLSGRLPRFVPFVASVHDGRGFEHRNIVVDLETGVVRPDAPVAIDTAPIAQQPELYPAWTLHRTSWIRSLRNEIQVFDGSTGQLAGTLKLSFTPFHVVDPRQAAGGKLWLHDPNADAVALVRIDLASMKPDLLIGPVRVSTQN